MRHGLLRALRAIAIGAIGAGATAGLYVALPGEPPTASLAAVRAAWNPSETRLEDRHGALLHERRTVSDARRLAFTPLADVSPALAAAVVAAEDHRFRAHGGVDWIALGGAARDALQGRRLRGASTLSMQLGALLDPSLRGGRGPRALLAKLRQMRAARAIEARFTKDEILEAYLNLASFRGELKGVAAASQGLFGRAPHGLDASASLVLAALLPAPNASPEAVAKRAAALARRTGQADPDETAALARTSLAHAPRISPPAALAPHLAARLLPDGAREDVRTTLDAEVQRLARRVLHEQLLSLDGRNVGDGAVLVVENTTGDVLAWVGGSGALSAAPNVDTVRARRQAGSTLKPFLYALAFDRRLLTPASRIEDAPLDVATPGGVYRPENYDRAFRGLVTARIALASSLNVPAVRTAQLVGVEPFVETLSALGFSELRRPDHYGESVALGSADVTLQELVNAYRALANGGVVRPLRVRADDPSGPERRVFSPAAAHLVTHVLADRESRGLTFGFESPLATPFFSAVKTGTSKDMRDNWCVGFTGRVTVGVWVGNASGAPMRQVSGVDGAAPAWLELVRALDRSWPGEAPPTPEGVVLHGGERYLAGTEPGPVAGAGPIAAERPQRIRAPGDGTRIAIDPNIPWEHQRVFFESDPPDSRLRFRLDGEMLDASAGELVLWPPVAGRHRLELVDADGATLDAVRFVVR